MIEDLTLLLEMNQLEKKAHELQLTKKDLPSRIAQLKAEISQEKAKLDQITHAVSDAKAKIQENKDLAVQEQTALDDSNGRLESISTNREYDAVHTEIAVHRKNIDTANANVLHFQQTLENLEKDYEAIETEYKRTLETNEPELEKLETELSGIEDRIAEQRKLAEAPRARISKRILSVYDRVRQRRETPNVISALSRGKKFCGICNRTQTPQRLIEISKQNSLITCESCGAILVWQEEWVLETSPLP